MTDEEYREVLVQIVEAADPVRAALRFLVLSLCVCNVGVQACPAHPGRLRTKEQKIEFRKDWDARVHA